MDASTRIALEAGRQIEEQINQGQTSGVVHVDVPDPDYRALARQLAEVLDRTLIRFEGKDILPTEPFQFNKFHREREALILTIRAALAAARKAGVIE